MEDYDLIVVGAGSSGTLAAIAAGRLGLNVCLIEKGPRIGGVPVNTLMGSFTNIYFDHTGTINASLIVGDVIERLIQSGATSFKSMEELMDVSSIYQITIPYQPEAYEAVLMDMLLEAGVTIYLNTEIADLHMINHRIDAITVQSNFESKKLHAKVFTDASGNATLAQRAGASTYCQTKSSYGCLMRIGGVDITKTLEYIGRTRQWEADQAFDSWLNNHLEGRAYQATGLNLRTPVTYDHAPRQNLDDKYMDDVKWQYILDRWKQSGLIYTLETSLFRHALKDAIEAGDYEIEMLYSQDKGVTMNGDGISVGSWGKNVALVNVAKAFGFNPGSMEDETKANIMSRQYNVMFAKFLKKYIPGFEESFLMDQGAKATNRSWQHVDNSAYKGGIYDMPIYTFKTIYQHVPARQIPYATILGDQVENLLVVGKGAYQSEQFRCQISCMLMGIASTAAANTLIADGGTIHTLNPEVFQSNLDLLFN